MSHAPFEYPYAHSIYQERYAHPGEEWADTADRVARYVIAALYSAPRGHQNVQAIQDAETRIKGLIAERLFIPGGRYLYATGRDLHQTQNCLLLRAEDSREGWAELAYKSSMALMTGAGIGVYYGDVRHSGAEIRRTGGVATGPILLMQAVNEWARATVQGGMRRSAIWAGLPWDHPDIFDFIRAKDWPRWLREKKEADPNMAAPLDMTNISVCLNEAFFYAYEDAQHPLHVHAREVYRLTLDKALTTAEPGFSIDLDDQVLRNACTEVISADDSDICNLGALVPPRFHDIEQYRSAVRDATLFLLAGTLYSDLPYEKVAEVREANRRLGLGNMGLHEWLLQRGRPYGPDAELGEWLGVYRDESDAAARYWAELFGLSVPVAKRAMAPHGTTGILGETTTSGEPLFAVAYTQGRVRASDTGADDHHREYIIDPVAQRRIAAGQHPDEIQDAYDLAAYPEIRLGFQAWVQRFLDQGMSSTINLPGPIRDHYEQAALGETLYPYLRQLRGVTFYPDGARGNQPLQRVPLSEALAGQVAVEGNEEACVSGACGI